MFYVNTSTPEIMNIRNVQIGTIIMIILFLCRVLQISLHEHTS